MEQRARAENVGWGDEFSVFVVDILNGSLRKWGHSADYETRQKFFFPIGISEAERSSFQAFRSAYLVVAQSGSPVAGRTIELPSTGYDSIYDLASCPSCVSRWVFANRHKISHQISGYDVFVARIGNLAASFGTSGAEVNVELVGNLKFKVVLASDASAGPLPAYCIGSLGPTGFQVDSSECFDSDGNKVPVEVGDLDLVYQFTRQSNLNNFRARVVSLGITFTVVGTTTAGPLRVICTGDVCTRLPD
ncbi:hypothetical protein EER27_15575 [Lysobacter psychrotolerans]|uniref:Uncharacterized protein n=2 Tax=Montanilutibacter psychrotolerans TaxID=1327343 RepID=A0A3M8SL25_9GAMM|nr:hypothetical protein EER27_15575 [Lysobacter psychrotolerans]